MSAFEALGYDSLLFPMGILYVGIFLAAILAALEKVKNPCLEF